MKYFFEGFFNTLLALCIIAMLVIGGLSLVVFCPWIFILTIIGGVIYSMTQRK